MVNIAILGAGNIAVKMAHTINGMVAAGNHSLAPYAVAARDEARAQQFAHDYGFQKAYGSYEEMLADPKVDLVYVATPHSHHYEHMRLCLSCGTNVLCEKAFTVNASQAEAVTNMAYEKGLYVAEAIWTRYLPSRKMIDELIASGAIGTPRVLTANLAYPLEHVERMLRPELAGGALLDLGYIRSISLPWCLATILRKCTAYPRKLKPAWMLRILLRLRTVMGKWPFSVPPLPARGIGAAWCTAQPER